MNSKKTVPVIVLLLFLTYLSFSQEKMDWNDLDHCTSVVISKSASVDGSVMTTHSCDGNYEFRIHLVPAKDHKPGTMRTVYKGGGRGRERGEAKKEG